ncbi:MAG: hypothetical protein Q8O40_09115 [Chloroflexota bacterium]|nr:hypothetical protein [Chloroflexota bacterium]
MRRLPGAAWRLVRASVAFGRLLATASWLRGLFVALLAGFGALLVFESVWPLSVTPYLGLRGLLVVVAASGFLALVLSRPSARESVSEGGVGVRLVAGLAAWGAAAVVWATTRGGGQKLALVLATVAAIATLVITEFATSSRARAATTPGKEPQSPPGEGEG